MAALQLTEDNARFLLLAVVLLLYMLAGAALFQYLESDSEARMARDFWRTYADFRSHYCKLLQAAANATYSDTGSPPSCCQSSAEARPPAGSAAPRLAAGGGDSAPLGADAGGGATNGSGGGGGGRAAQGAAAAAAGAAAPDVMERVHRLLYAYGNASAAGIIHKRRRWDFAGSFHFVGTIVSTIGYGNTTPQTTAGKAVVILYGFLGCSGGILFFNLFLERIITLLACGLRALHLRRLRRRVAAGRLAQRRISGATMAASRRLSRASLPSQDYIDDDIDDSILDNWKPSVYWVMLYLAAASACVASCAAAVYSPVEDWSFFEALYFCFVSFATIGFGDYVTTQEPDYPHVHWYRFGNFVFLVLGCCCIYSLFNVTSIVIKQFLNWLIVKLACRGVCGTAGGPRRPSVIAVRKGSQRRRRSSSVRGRRRSSAGLPQNLRRPPPLAGVLSRGAAPVPVCSTSHASSASDADSDTEAGQAGAGPRRLSGELISMKEFLRANKVSLAVMQKQLYETAQMSRSGYVPQVNSHGHGHARNHPGGGGGGAGGGGGGGSGSSAGGGASSGRFVPGTVGPLAMLSQKLDTSGR